MKLWMAILFAALALFTCAVANLPPVRAIQKYTTLSCTQKLIAAVVTIIGFMMPSCIHLHYQNALLSIYRWTKVSMIITLYREKDQWTCKLQIQRWKWKWKRDRKRGEKKKKRRNQSRKDRWRWWTWRRKKSWRMLKQCKSMCLQYTALHNNDTG